MEKHVFFLPVFVLIAGCTSADPDIVGVDSDVDVSVTDVSVTETLTDAREDIPTDSRRDTTSAGDLGGDGALGDSMTVETLSDSQMDVSRDDATVDAADSLVADSSDTKDSGVDVGAEDGLPDGTGEAGACTIVPNPLFACNDSFRAKYRGVTVCCSMPTENAFCDSSLAGCPTGKTLFAYCEKATGTIKYGEGTCVIPF